MNDELEKVSQDSSLISLMRSCCPVVCMKGLNKTTENPNIDRVVARIQVQSITAALICPVTCSALGVRRHFGARKPYTDSHESDFEYLEVNF
jgi:hypothetical protein